MTITLDPADLTNGTLYSGRLSPEQFAAMPQRYRDVQDQTDIVTLLRVPSMWIVLTESGRGLWLTADRDIPQITADMRAVFTEGWYIDTGMPDVPWRPEILAEADAVVLDLHGRIARLVKDNRDVEAGRQAAEAAMRAAQTQQRDAERAATQAREEAEACRESLAAFKVEVRNAVIAEAEEREWCDEVESWLSDLGLPGWKKTWTVEVETTVRTQIDITATSEADAMAQIREDLLGEDASVDFDPFRVKSPGSSVIVTSTVETAEEED